VIDLYKNKFVELVNLNDTFKLRQYICFVRDEVGLNCRSVYENLSNLSGLNCNGLKFSDKQVAMEDAYFLHDGGRVAFEHDEIGYVEGFIIEIFDGSFNFDVCGVGSGFKEGTVSVNGIKIETAVIYRESLSCYVHWVEIENN
jgi:hypothetical protein